VTVHNRSRDIDQGDRTIPLPLQGILETMLRHKMDPELRQAAVRQKQAMKNVKL